MSPFGVRVELDHEESENGDKPKRITRFSIIIPSAIVSALVSLGVVLASNGHLDLSDPATQQAIKEAARPEPWTRDNQQSYALEIRQVLMELEHRLGKLETEGSPDS